MLVFRKEAITMIEQDTIKLLRECDSGIKMGVSSIEDTLKYVRSRELKRLLENSKKSHSEINCELLKLLDIYHDSGKEPPVMVQAMSKIKSSVKLQFEGNDSASAELIIDGCNMGVKSLSRYLNKYKAADERSKDLTKRLISLEEELSVQMRKFLQ